MVHPELAGLFLRQRVGAEDRAKRAPSRGAVASAQMIPLPAAAVIEDARAAPLLAHSKEARGDLADCGVPVDFLEAAVGPPPHRRSQPVSAILVVVNPLRLLAGVALRRDMLPVSVHARDMPPFELHLDSAIDTAQDANRLLPVFTHGTTPSCCASVHLSNYIVQQENELRISGRQAGGGGRESNPPATILAARPVLKTGKATGPFPPPALID